jgi:hypothetical protein
VPTGIITEPKEIGREATSCEFGAAQHDTQRLCLTSEPRRYNIDRIGE